MSYKLSIQKKHGYLHAKVSGENSIENVKFYLEEILKKCMIEKYPGLLIEEKLDGPRLDTINVFKIASEGSDLTRGHLKAIAYVDVNAEGELMRFAETVAVNRALPVKVFPTVSDAENWIIEQVQIFT